MRTYSKNILQLISLYILVYISTSQSNEFSLSSEEVHHHRQNIELIGNWFLWKTKHGREYKSIEEELKRYSVWKDNLAFIDEHNRDRKRMGYSLGMNHFGDLVSLSI